MALWGGLITCVLDDANLGLRDHGVVGNTLDAARWLAKDGHLVVETSPDQAAAGVEACTAAGLRADMRHSEEYDATVLVAALA